MTNTANQLQLESKSDISNPILSIWSQWFGNKEQRNKINQDKKKRRAEESKLIKLTTFPDSLSVELNEELAKFCAGKIHEQSSLARIQALTRRRRIMHLKMLSMAETRAHENQLIINNVIDELRCTGELESLIIKHLDKKSLVENIDVKTQVISEEACSSTINIELDITKTRIEKLADCGEEDEDGSILKPTEYATKKAIDLVSEVAQLCHHSFSKAWVLAENNGGIYLIWSKPDSEKELRVLVPHKEEFKIYLYHEEKDKYDSVDDAAAKDLSDWINWINS
jgi:hypothetical protein